jgi:hypothetical protein
VGKTSLRKALTGQPLDPSEKSTAGAQVTCALLRCEVDQVNSGWKVDDSGVSGWEEDAQRAYYETRLKSASGDVARFPNDPQASNIVSPTDNAGADEADGNEVQQDSDAVGVHDVADLSGA